MTGTIYVMPNYIEIDAVYDNIKDIGGWFDKDDIEAFSVLELPANPVIVEIGTAYGRSTLAFSLLWPNAEIHTCDPVPQLLSPNLWGLGLGMALG